MSQKYFGMPSAAWVIVLLLLLVAAMALTGCGKNVKVPVGQSVNRGTYVYIEMEPNRYHVAVTVNSSLDVLNVALDELGCKGEAVCVVSKFGDLFVVEKYPQ